VRKLGRTIGLKQYKKRTFAKRDITNLLRSKLLTRTNSGGGDGILSSTNLGGADFQSGGDFVRLQFSNSGNLGSAHLQKLITAQHGSFSLFLNCFF